MTQRLPKNAHQIFEREHFTFKKIKETHNPTEVEQIKLAYKETWQAWKALQLDVFASLSAVGSFEKPKIESWTNGWILRNHFWAAYRLSDAPNSNACLAVLFNRKQLQIYLMYQRYRSEQRSGDIETYNAMLAHLPSWSEAIDLHDYYIWPQQEHELVDHLLLHDYLVDAEKQAALQAQAYEKSFQLGKIRYTTNDLGDEKAFILQGFKELTPLLQTIINQK